jgi:hypothetical protein
MCFLLAAAAVEVPGAAAAAALGASELLKQFL